MKRIALTLALIAVGGVGTTTSQVEASVGRCDRCGCEAHCHSVCRKVPGVRKVVDYCYDCECEDFCIPGPSRRCGRECETIGLPGEECGCNGGCSSCTISWTNWIPGCATVRSRKVLVKYEIVKEVPTCEWVVENLCGECSSAPAEHAGLLAPNAGEVQTVSAKMPIGAEASQEAAPKKRSLLDVLLGK